MFAKNITIEKCRKIAEKQNKKLGVNVFLELVRDDISIFCYNIMMSGAFDSEKSQESRILQEMRGITFNNKTGQLLARKYHKFFNLGENQGFNPDFNKPHIFLDKLDGSMCVPIIINNELVLHTKRGYSDVAIKATDFMKTKPNIIDFCEKQIKAGFTPIFEYVAPDNLIVLKYNQTDLILTGIRNIKTGIYVKYDKLKKLALSNSISIVRDIKTDILNAKNTLKSANDIEGYVVRFDSGDMVKMKADQYVSIHKAKDTLRYEKDVVKIILENKIDDLISLLDADTAKVLTTFNSDFLKGLQNTVDYIKSRVSHYKNMIDNQLDTKEVKKQFALLIQNEEHTLYKNFILSSFDSGDNQIMDRVKKELAFFTGSTPRIESKRYLYNVDWKDYYKLIGEDNE